MILLTFPPTVHKGSIFSTSSSILVSCLFDNRGILIGMKSYLIVLLIFISLMICWTCFHVPVGHLDVFFGKILCTFAQDSFPLPALVPQCSNVPTAVFQPSPSSVPMDTPIPNLCPKFPSGLQWLCFPDQTQSDHMFMVPLHWVWTWIFLIPSILIICQVWISVDNPICKPN